MGVKGSTEMNLTDWVWYLIIYCQLNFIEYLYKNFYHRVSLTVMLWLAFLIIWEGTPNHMIILKDVT